MKKANLPLTSRAHGTYVEVTPRRRLAYRTLADFIPGIAPYEIGAVIDFHAVPRGVRLTITEDAMHNEEWTKMSEMGMSRLAGPAREGPRGEARVRPGPVNCKGVNHGRPFEDNTGEAFGESTV